MSATRRLSLVLALGAVTGAFSFAQNVLSAHAGTVHYFEGDVSLGGVKVSNQVGRFTQMKELDVLSTSLGRAEVLLTPGVVLRVGENSSIRMLNNSLMSTRVELVSGTAMLEQVDPGSSVKDPAVTIVYKDFDIQPVRYGLFEVGSSPEELRVFKGEAKATLNSVTLNAKEGNSISLGSTMAVAKFDVKDADDLYLWSRDRSAYLAAANMASARTLGNSYLSSTWSGFSGGWYYNSLLGIYSFMPFRGTMYSPFGFGLYNPYTIAYAYAPTYFWPGSGGAKTGTTTGLPLQSIQPTGSSAHPTLPRLGVTASLRPTQSVAAPGTQPINSLRVASSPRTSGIASTSSSSDTTLSARNVGSVSTSSSSSVAAPTVMSAPSAPAASSAASAPRASSARR